jgi:hypothetical protein
MNEFQFVLRGLTMSSNDSPSSPEIFGERESSQFLLLCIVRGVVEKHGGSMKIDRKTSSAVLSIPKSKKAACFEELEEIIGHGEPFKDFFPFLH